MQDKNSAASGESVKEGVIPHVPSYKQWHRKPLLACGAMHCCDRIRAINLNLTKKCDCVKKLIAFISVLLLVLCLFGCATTQQEGKMPASNTEQGNVPNNKEIAPNDAIGTYTYEELSEMPANELLDLFIQNGLVVNDDLKASYTEEELSTLFKENFHLWHTGVSAYSYTAYIDLAEQTKVIYDKIAEPKK